MNWNTAFVVGVTLILQIGQSDGQWNPFSFLLQQDYQGNSEKESSPARSPPKLPNIFGQDGSGAGAGNSLFGVPMGLGALGGLNSLGLQPPRPNELLSQLSMGLLDGNSLLNGGGLLGSMLGGLNKARSSRETEIGGASAGGGARIGAPLQSMPVIGSASSGSSGNINPVDAEISRLYNSGGGGGVGSSASGSNSAPSGVGGSDKVDPATIAKLLTATTGNGSALEKP